MGIFQPKCSERLTTEVFHFGCDLNAEKIAKSIVFSGVGIDFRAIFFTCFVSVSWFFLNLDYVNWA